jgi:4-aminobutyrate aminotransferase/(S)-3-amino-2-methylpropionate transaminase
VGTIQLKTEMPGPKSREMLARRLAAVTTGLGRATEVVVERAEGAVLYDVDGNVLLDMAGGIGMLAVGHCPPQVVNAITEQAQKLIHLCAIVGTYEPYVALSELLNSVTPGDFPKKTLLSNSGSEAVENAVNFARAYTKRPAVISFEGAYHGRTLMAMSLTSKYALFKKGFGPFAPEVYRLPMPYLYRKPQGVSDEEFVEWSIQQLNKALVAQVDPSAVAAIIVEPVQGEAGFVPVPPRFLERIRQICTEHGIVMIADEVQAGMGRTGKLFAIEHYGIVPDLITMAKSMGAGMPISAVTGRAEIMDAPHPGGVGGTYSGAPLSCVAAIEAINTIRQPEFLARVTEIGKLMREILTDLQSRHPIIGDVRGLGAMMLIELVKDPTSKDPMPDETLAIIKEAYRRGVVFIRAGLYTNCIRFLPPLTITDEQLHEAFEVLEEAMKVVGY